MQQDCTDTVQQQDNGETDITKVASVSLGSSARDHKTRIQLKGRTFELWREGCDGDHDRLVRRLRELDGDDQVAAIGLGGLDFFMDSAGRRYWFREVKPLLKLVKNKAFVGGGGLKGAFEKSAVTHMAEAVGGDLSGKTVLCLSGVDRWGMACGFEEAGCQVNYGDIVWTLGLPIMVRSQKAFIRLARTLAPLVVKLPFQMLYDSNADHRTEPKPNKVAEREMRNADIIAGDYKMVIQHLPEDLKGKWVLTNTTTPEDVAYLRDLGVELLVTTTPRLEGRSFGTNLIEATLIALEGADAPLDPQRYVELARECSMVPSVAFL